MLRALNVAKYFLSKDPEGRFFNKNLITKNGRTFYSGNARLNKYLHISQNLYIAKTGTKLFSDDLYAYDNGAVVPYIQENYAVLLHINAAPHIPEDEREFLDMVYAFLEDAEIEDLIEISHEDTEWQKKHQGYYKSEQKMDSLAHADEYRAQYHDALLVMEKNNI